MPIRDLILNLREQKSGHALLDAANDLDRAADGADRFGDSTKALERDMHSLESQISRTHLRIKDLSAQFTRTGDRTLFGDLRREKAFLAQLERVRKEIGGPAGGGNLFAAIPRIGGVPGPLIGAGVAATAALAPFLGGVVASAVLGTVGTGGVIGGIALASQDTRVRAAWKDLGTNVFAELGDASAPFVQPLLNVAKSWGAEWKAEAGPIRKIFTDLATTVEPLGEGVSGFVRALTPGLSTAVKASLPLATQFSHEFERFGGATGRFLEEMADSAPGARIALHDLFTVVDEGLEQLGQGIHFLSETYEWSRKLGLVAPPEWLMQASKGLIPAVMDLGRGVQAYHRDLSGAGPAAAGLNRELKNQEEAAREAAKAMERNTKAIDDYFDTVMGRLDATEHWHRAMLDLNDSVKENGTSLAINTREGLANRDALEDVARAVKERYDAGLITDAQYQAEIKSLERQAIALGMNKDAVYALLGAFEKLPSQVITEVLVKVGGEFAQLQKIFSLGGISRQTAQQGRGGTDFSLTPVVRGADSRAFLDLPSRDVGGPVQAGRSYMIGGRPEILTMGSSSGFVTPTGGGNTTIVLAAAGTGDPLMDALWREFRKRIVIEGGHGSNSVQIALGQ